MRSVDLFSRLLVVVGALNWGLVAAFRFDLVAALFGLEFGQVSVGSAIVYALVGLAGFVQAATLLSAPSRRPALAD